MICSIEWDVFWYRLCDESRRWWMMMYLDDWCINEQHPIWVYNDIKWIKYIINNK
jgi:hypothetical protein